MGGKGKRYSPPFQFQVVLEVLKGDRDAVEITRAYELHPSTVSRWKREFLENGANGNTMMESFNSRFKAENGDLFHGAANIWELERLIANQIEYHNSRRRHSALGYTAPIDYIIQEEILPRPALGLALHRT